jgi:hypothetical protein
MTVVRYVQIGLILLVKGVSRTLVFPSPRLTKMVKRGKIEKN